MLQFSQLTKKFHSTTVLSIESFTIPEGLNYIIGGNGVGKTTLLRVVAGLSPFEGELLFMDKYHPVRDAVVWRQSVTFGAAEPAFPLNANGRDLVRIFQRVHGGDQEVAKDIIHRFQMEGFLKSPIKSYSAGMKKKLSLLLTFMGQPKLILLDEPMITLDNTTRTELMGLISTFLKQGCNFLISTHLTTHDESAKVNPVLEVAEGSIQIASPERIKALMPVNK